MSWEANGALTALGGVYIDQRVCFDRHFTERSRGRMNRRGGTWFGAYRRGVVLYQPEKREKPALAATGGVVARANSAIFKVRDFSCFFGLKYVPSM